MTTHAYMWMMSQTVPNNTICIYLERIMNAMEMLSFDISNTYTHIYLFTIKQNSFYVYLMFFFSLPFRRASVINTFIETETEKRWKLKFHSLKLVPIEFNKQHLNSTLVNFNDFKSFDSFSTVFRLFYRSNGPIFKTEWKEKEYTTNTTPHK